MVRLSPTYIVFHTAAWPGDPSARDIDRSHRQRGFARIGYHYLIRKDGTVEKGREDHQTGAHCRDSGMNRKALGICFSGHHNREDWTEAQRRAWLGLASKLMRRHNIPVENVIGHREAGARKDCPGTRIDCDAVRAELARFMRREDGKQPGEGGLLGRGDFGPEVGYLQRLLVRLGHDPGPVDNHFGPRTEAALRRAQTQAGLVPDGLFGPVTKSKLSR
ncbi:MAG: N-acetylmuramoyl-L-alanine amidase [Bacteroidota bacterium]